MAGPVSDPGRQPTGKLDAQTETNRVKKAFLAHMRHELRTPLNAIIGYSELLLDDAAEQDHQSFAADLEKINASGRQLLSLVNDILDQSKIDVRDDIRIEEFEAEVRHALRTPLTVIIGYADIIAEDAGEAHHDDLIADIRRIRSAAERLLALTNDILSLWRVQAGKTGLDAQGLSSFQMVQDAMTTIRPLSEGSDRSDSAATGLLLVVDDNETNRDLLSRYLKREGHRVIEAENGRQALEVLGRESIDLVLLDILMPEMNGYQVLTHLKADDTLRHLPVIMLSALDDMDSVVRCIEMGADDYLPKPFNPTLLKARIGSCLEKKKLRDREQAYLEQLRIEREKSERLLLNILPSPIAERLKQGESLIADGCAEATVIFADLVGFTRYSANTPAAELVGSLNSIFSAFDRLTECHGMEKIKTIGDAYMAVAGLPRPLPGHVEAAANMALDVLEYVNQARAQGITPFQVRIGLNTGPVIAGVIGTKKFIYDLWGDTVNTASRMESHSIPGGIRVTEAVYQCLQGRYVFGEPEILDIKDKGPMKTYLLKARMV